METIFRSLSRGGVFFFLSSVQAQMPLARIPGPDFAPGEVVLGFQGGVSVQSLNTSLGRYGLIPLRSFPQINACVMRSTKGEDVRRLCQNLAGIPGVRFVEPNYSRRILLAAPNDPAYNNLDTEIAPLEEEAEPTWFQWGLHQIQALEAWGVYPNQYYTSATKPANALKIAVIDTGIDIGGTDDIPQPDFINAGGSSPDAALGGQVDLADARNVLAGYSPTDVADDFGHGTAVAGVLGAGANNGGDPPGNGIAGLAYPCQIMPIKAMDDTGYGTEADLTAAILWAVDHGALIINISAGDVFYSQLEQDAVEYAWSHGSLIVAAAGNEGDSTNRPYYPAACSGVMAVGATTWPNDYPASYSNFGDYVGISAPGGDVSLVPLAFWLIWTTMPTEYVPMHDVGWEPSVWTYQYQAGTSLAAPFVAGLAGLYAAAHGITQSTPNGVLQIWRALQRGCDNVGGTAGWHPYWGWGRINAYQTLLNRDNRGAALGCLTGQVTYYGTVVGNAVVKATPVGGGSSKSATTKSDGTYRIANLNPGLYNVSATYFGLTETLSDIPVEASMDQPRVNIPLPMSGTATRLIFTVQPSNAKPGAVISPPIQVAAQDDLGNIDAAFTSGITVALGSNPGGGTLGGTKTVRAFHGVAVFSDLSLDQVGKGYTLTASASGLTGATSAPFNITMGEEATILAAEDFEGSFPARGWRVWDQNGLQYGEHYWGRMEDHAHQGRGAAWCAAGGASPRPFGGYPPHCRSWLVYGPFSLAQVAVAELSFWCDYEIEAAGDTFFYGYSTDGQNFQGEHLAGASGGYVEKRLDLSPAGGRPQVWIAFLFVSDGVGTARGVWIDDVVVYSGGPALDLPAGQAVQDTFEGSAGASLAERVPVGSGGKGWQVASGAFLVEGGQVRPRGEEPALAFLETGRSDGLVEGTWRTGSAGPHYGGLVFRLKDSRNFYLLRAHSGAVGAELALYVCQEGVWAPLGSATVRWQAGQTYRLQVVLEGASILCLVEDQPRIAMRSEFNVAARGHGLWGQAALDGQSGFEAFRVTSSPAWRSLSGDPVVAVGEEDAEWQVRLAAFTAGGSDPHNYFGVSLRPRVLENPSFSGGEVDLSFVGADIPAEGAAAVLHCGPLRRPFLLPPPYSSLSTWTWQFVVRTARPQKEVTLAWPSLRRELPAGLEAVLVDGATGQRFRMDTRAGYTFRSAEGEGRYFRVEVARAKQGKVKVVDFVVLPRREGSQWFQVGLTGEARVWLEVASLTGRRVRVLPVGSCRAGVTTVDWDLRDEAGRRVPPGVYIVTLLVSDEAGPLTGAVRTVVVR